MILRPSLARKFAGERTALQAEHGPTDVLFGKGSHRSQRTYKFPLVIRRFPDKFPNLFMKTAIHPKYVDAEIRCACGNVIKTRSTRSTIIVGICNVCHPFYTGQQKFVDTAGRVDKFQQRLAKTQAAQAEHATKKKKKA